MAVEFLPWYTAGATLLMCSGDDGCGALVHDTEIHLSWHRKIENGNGVEIHAVPPEDPYEVAHKVWHQLSPAVCKDPDCTIPLKPGRAMHGPHDFIAGKS